MMQTMRPRGPDGNGTYIGNECCLLHTRLAIIDPECGAQPMSLHWGNEIYTITYNGELYNTEELRTQLLSRGHHFLGHSDTEVLLHGYVQWGEGVLQKLNGIFAFAIWQENSQTLFLARDRMGVKPLFFSRYRGGLLFASEMKTILAYPGFPRMIDSVGIAEIILMGPGRTPGCGVFSGIEELRPGFCASFHRGEWSLRRYWKLTDGPHTESFEDTCAHVRALLTDAVRRQMVSDVPIGTFLSGGLDSSLITAIFSKEMAKRGEILDTFSVDYQDNDRFFQAGKFQPNADAPYIRVMEAAFPLHSHHTVLTPQDLSDVLEAATLARDLPGMADVDFSLLAFCREIRKTVKTALSGECADEIFGGYPWYRDPEIRDRDGFPWAQNISARLSLLPEPRRKELQDYSRDRYQETLTDAHILPGNSPLETRMKQMVNLNLQWFMQTLLDRKDRMSMYWGLEVRVPFCDYRIVQYLYTVPWEMKNYQGREKGLLRKAMEGILPEQILWRKKSPYPKTFHPEYRAIMDRRMKALLEEKSAPLWSVILPDQVTAMMEGELSVPWYGQLMREPQTMAYLLQVNFWLEHYGINIQ